jgi:hypothetical protein
VLNQKSKNSRRRSEAKLVQIRFEKKGGIPDKLRRGI